MGVTHSKKLSPPVVIYADIEAVLENYRTIEFVFNFVNNKSAEAYKLSNP